MNNQSNNQTKKWKMDRQAARNQYETAEVPEELGQVIEDSWKEGIKMRNEQKAVKRYPKVMKWSAAGVACLCLAFTLSVNAIPSFAAAVEDVPVLGAIARVITIDKLAQNDKYSEIEVNVPGVEGLENKDAQKNINKVLSADAIKVYDKALADADVLKKTVEKSGVAEFMPTNVYQSYAVMTYTNQLLAIKTTVTETAASAAETVKTYNFDLLNNKLLIMADLFQKDFDYTAAINKEVTKQINAAFAKDQESFKFFKIGEEGAFTGIRGDQSFYITEQGKLVIVFDEYEVGPGASGMIEMEIPTGVFDGQISSANYLR